MQYPISSHLNKEKKPRKSVHQQKGEHPPRSVCERSNVADSLCSSQPALLGRDSSTSLACSSLDGCC
ncbi:hypothetical protein SLEP1_g32995 [Rubroshorea leprosula]|uniref:Uncharacterized protein n=1 Tax=Rubroshorea leprosula TaxID=152421 RepID=A0AAV5KF84_9ROSI|nr:hypothetical protein SLEP1_g32995 [Rubroshorea leprosula]